MAARAISDLPGPKGLPLIGNAHRVRSHSLHLTAERWCEEYGPVYRLDFGPRRVVVLGDVDAINAALRDRPDGFRRWREILEITEEIAHVGVFAAEGDDWRRMRRLAVTALNSNHLQRYFEIVSTCTGRLQRRLQAAAEDGCGFEIGEALSSFTVDVTSALAFGHDLNTLERGDGGLQEHLHRVFQMTNRRIFMPFPTGVISSCRRIEHSIARSPRSKRRSRASSRRPGGGSRRGQSCVRRRRTSSRA
jgi:cytochrome P450